MAHASITIAEVRETFLEEIETAGGALSDRWEDGERLIVRATLPWIDYVRPGDSLQGGIAMRATLHDAVAHPYIVRKVCVNGAIAPVAIATHRVSRMDEFPAEAAREKVREAVRVCASEELFASFTNDFRATVGAPLLDAPHLLMAMLAEQPGVESRASLVELFRRVFMEFARSRDLSRFGLVNAVTAVARETADPEARWRLEELGGSMVVMKTPRAPRLGAAAHAVRVREAEGAVARE